MFAFRLLAGISAAFASPQVWAAIPQLVQPHKVLKAMGVATAGLAFSQMLGVPIGSYLATAGWQTPFMVIGCCTFLIVIWTAVLLPALPPSIQKQKAPSIRNRYRSLLQGSTPKVAFSGLLPVPTRKFCCLLFYWHMAVRQIQPQCCKYWYGDIIPWFRKYD